MSELDYIRSLDDEGLTKYLLRICIVFSAGPLGLAGVQVDQDMEIPEYMVSGLLQALQQPHKGGSDK